MQKGGRPKIQDGDQCLHMALLIIRGTAANPWAAARMIATDDSARRRLCRKYKADAAGYDAAAHAFFEYVEATATGIKSAREWWLSQALEVMLPGEATPADVMTVARRLAYAAGLTPADFKQMTPYDLKEFLYFKPNKSNNS